MSTCSGCGGMRVYGGSGDIRCMNCGKVRFKTEYRTCGSCRSFKKKIGVDTCAERGITVHPDMKITFNLEKGSCWTNRDGGN